MAQTGFDKTYDVRSVKSMSLVKHIAKKNVDHIMSGNDFASGTGFSVQMDAEAITPVNDFNNHPHYFESGGVAGTGTFTILTGTDEDKLFQAQFNDDKGKGDTYTFTDSVTGERVTVSDAIITNQAQTGMESSEANRTWTIKGIFKRTFDGAEDIDKIL